MRADWKPLPEELSPAARELVETLRAIKDEHKLSLADLAAKTYYSKASWERWLNGKRLVTPQALQRLSDVCACDLDRLTELLGRATRPPGEQEAVTPEAAIPEDSNAPQPPLASPAEDAIDEAGAAGGAAGSRPGRLRLWAVAGALAAVVVAAGGYLAFGTGPAKTVASASHSTSHSSSPTPASPGCKRTGCEGKDPGTTGCATDGRTVITANDGKVTLYIRYSPRCQAAWAKLTEGAPGDTATITTSSGQSQTALIHWGYDAFSPMVDAGGGTVLKVCGHQPEGDACTPEINDVQAFLEAHRQ